MRLEPLLLVVYFCNKNIEAPCSATQRAYMQYSGANDFIRKIPSLVDDSLKTPVGIAAFAGRTIYRQEVDFRTSKSGIANSLNMNYNYTSNTANLTLGWSFNSK